MNPTTSAEARLLAEHEIAGGKYDLVIVGTKELASGWVFYVAPRRYAETGDRQFAVPGLGPVFVGRDGIVRRVPTADPEGFISRLDEELRGHGSTPPQ
jgi:hypothetical protein